MRSEYGSVLFSTPRLKAMDVVLDDYLDLCDHWTKIPPAADFHTWKGVKRMGLVQDMISDQVEEARSCYRLILRDRRSNDFAGYINAWKIGYYHFLPELGIALEPEYQNKGYGTEIYRALIGFAFDKFGADAYLQAVINPDNTPSLKMHFNCGWQPFCFVKDGYKEDDIVEDEVIVRISRAHFQKNGAYRSVLSLL